MTSLDDRSRTARRVAAPYGVAFLAVVVDFLAGGAAGAGLQPLFWVLYVSTGLLIVGWLLTVVLAVRAVRLLGLVTLPSALLVWAIVTQIPLLVGGCVLGRECI